MNSAMTLLVKDLNDQNLETETKGLAFQGDSSVALERNNFRYLLTFIFYIYFYNE